MPIRYPAAAANPENARLAWQSLVTSGNIIADSAAAGFPAVNLANPTTFQLWRAAAIGTVTLAVNFGLPAVVDYVGIARHNFGSGGISYTLQGTTDGSTWTDLAATQLPLNDGVILHEFTRQELLGVRLLLGTGSAPPQAAVLMAGALTVLQRRIYVGHTPIPYGRQTTVSTGMSESGQFLGRVIRRQQFQTSIAQQNLDPEWYRLNLAPFDAVVAVQPFFFAWRPYPYPEEVGYCWATADSEVSNQRSNGMVQWSLNGIQGIIR